MLSKQLDFVLKGGRTKRYHTNGTIPPQSVAEHTFFVAMIAGLLYPDDLALVGHILMHDLGEGHVGDVASPVKRKDPILKSRLDDAEMAARLECGFGPGAMDIETKRRLKMCDNMEGLLYCAELIRNGNHDAVEIYNNFHEYIITSSLLTDNEVNLMIEIERRCQCRTPRAPIPSK